jgi:exopolysaccharide biosynthesis polyprenyl glycosylphosphotransferase
MLGLTLAFLMARLRLVPEARRPDYFCLVISAISLPIWLAAFVHYRLYMSRFVSSRPSELTRVLHAVLTGLIGMAAMSFLLKFDASRSWLVVSFLTVFLVCILARQAVRWGFDSLRRKGGARRDVVLIGTNAEAQRIYQQLQRDPRLGYHVVGTISDTPERLDGLAYLGPTDDGLTLARNAGVTGALIASTGVSAVATNRLVRELTNAGIHVELSSVLADVGAERLTVRPLGYLPTLYIEPVRQLGWRAVAKRVFDLAVSVFALIVLAPLLAVVAVAVKLDSRGPVFFKQVRVGKHEEPFKVIKFRTMVVNAEELLADLREKNEADGPLFKLHSDPRVTRIGAVLRRYSIDELPQLLNVLVGQMSVVGPRPALFPEMRDWTEDLRRAKLSVRPGLTGIWQVSGRSNLSFADYVRLDLFYVHNWSLWRDLAIVFRTIPVVFKKEGAY